MDTYWHKNIWMPGTGWWLLIEVKTKLELFIKQFKLPPPQVHEGRKPNVH